MPWLVVLGNGSWMPRPGMRFTAGVHEISDEVAIWARKSKLKMLLVMDREPEIEPEHQGGPLTPDKLKNAHRGVRLKVEPLPEAEEEEYEVPLEYPCLYCDSSFPSDPARDRHIELQHGADA